MKKQTEQGEWDQFWKRRGSSRFTQKSWSKIRMMRLLDPYVRAGMRVLDAGCGSGFFSGYFISKGCAVYSLDDSEEALRLTRKATAERSAAYLKYDLLNNPLADQYQKFFDLIFTDGLFEHFDGDGQKQIMAVFQSIKQPEGLITTFVPNRYSWWQLARPLVMPGIKETPMTQETLRNLHKPMTIVGEGGINVLPFMFSPDQLLGARFGMIVYCFAR